MEMCWFGLTLLLVFYGTLPAEAQPPEVKPRYQNFLNRHIYGDMIEAKCNSVMDKRGITDGNTNNCKKVNTFIKASSNLVNTVCAGRTGDFTSGQPFTVVRCILQSGERRPNCNFKGHKSTRNIKIACDKGWPVHYDEDTVVVG